MIDASYTELKARLLFPLKSTLASIRVISRIMSLCSYKIKHSVPGKEGKNPQYCQYNCAIILLLLGGGFINIVRIHSSLNLAQKYLASNLSFWIGVRNPTTCI